MTPSVAAAPELLYRSERVVVLAKPAGLVVHRSPSACDRVTCLTLLRDRLGKRVYPVHRLDRGTSGALLFALDAEAAAALQRQFAHGLVSKAYLAVVRGFTEAAGRVDHPIADDSGRAPVPARTEYRRLARVELPHPVGRYGTVRYSLVDVGIATGRHHQIRRHFAHLRHPVLGDVHHGDGRHNRFARGYLGTRRLFLHARRLVFRAPDSDDAIAVAAPLPDDLLPSLARLGFGRAALAAIAIELRGAESLE